MFSNRNSVKSNSDEEYPVETTTDDDYEDAHIIEQSQVGTPCSPKLMAATVAIRNELRAEKDNIPSTLKSFVDSLDSEKIGSHIF